jgi:colanic acid biosynthesis protein WcaH
MDQTLLFRRNNEPLKGVYYTLGGRILKNENAIDTAVRKLEEEANIIVNNKNKLFLGGITEECFRGSIFESVDTHNVNIFFGCKINNGTSITMDNQHSRHKWFSVESSSLHPLIAHKINMIRKSDYFLYQYGIIKVTD